jgi:hypothetical protein
MYVVEIAGCDWIERTTGNFFTQSFKKRGTLIVPYMKTTRIVCGLIK